MFPSHTRQEPRAQYTHAVSGNVDLRDRIKGYPIDGDENENRSRSPNEPKLFCPIEVFFAHPIRPDVQHQVRHSNATHGPKGRQPQREVGRPQVLQEPLRPSVNELQSTASTLGKQMIDYAVAESDDLYASVVTRLTDVHSDLSKIVAETASEDNRVTTLVNTNQKKISKPVSEMVIQNLNQNGQLISISDRIASFKENIDVVEAEVASLWDQWRVAQEEVDSISSELARAQDPSEEHYAGAVGAVRKSLEQEMAKVEEELDVILSGAHEDARVSEKNFSKQIKSVMSALLQQYLLED